MRSKLVIDKINEMKMKLGSKVIARRAGKTKVDSELSIKAVNSAKRKRVEEVIDLGQGDDRLPGTDRIITDVAMVPPILMAGLKSTGYNSKRSDRTLTGATLEKTQPMWREYHERLQTLSHEPRKGKCRRTTGPSGI